MSDPRRLSMTPEAITARLKRVAELVRVCRALKARPSDAVNRLPARPERAKDDLGSGERTG